VRRSLCIVPLGSSQRGRGAQGPYSCGARSKATPKHHQGQVAWGKSKHELGEMRHTGQNQLQEAKKAI
jgi:hypothetical protein